MSLTSIKSLNLLPSDYSGCYNTGMTKADIKQPVNWDFQTLKFDSIDEILDFAISREINAQEFYKELAAIVKDEQLSGKISSLVGEELHHELTLYRIKKGMEGFKNEDISQIDFVDYSSDVKIDAKMNYSDLMLICMKKEETSRRLYTNLASICTEKQMSDLFVKLAQEEARHKLRFEVEYDLLTF
jgi:rubrerythrin